MKIVSFFPQGMESIAVKYFGQWCSGIGMSRYGTQSYKFGNEMDDKMRFLRSEKPHDFKSQIEP